MRRGAAVLAALSLSGCATQLVLPADPARTFDPVTFFAGRTAGEGQLRKLFSAPESISVTSIGRPDGRGGLVLDQLIRSGTGAPRQRRWIARPLGAGRFVGTLTDASGPVTMTVAGPRATIRYTMTNGLAVEQQLALQPGGRTLLNHLTVSKFGVRVARLDETIRKLP